MPVGYSIYRETGSYIHRNIDPRTKLAWLLTFFVLSLCSNNPAILAVVFVAELVLARIAKLKFKDLRAYLLLSLWLTVLSTIIWPAYIHQGAYLGRVWFVDVTSDGLLYGVAMGLRITIMIVAAAEWMLTTSPQWLTAGLLKLGLPYRAGLALSSAIRFVPFLNAERLTITEAQRARCATIGSGGPVRRIANSAPVLVPLFSRAFLTAQSLSIALDARGLGSGGERTSLINLRLSRADKAALVVAVLLVVAAIAFRVLGYGVLLKGEF